MKKLFIILICTAFATGVAMAQKTITWGPKIGVDLTHYWGKDALGHKPQLNYQAGAYLEFRFTNKLSLCLRRKVASGATMTLMKMVIKFHTMPPIM